jgi:hypothetical protein
MVGISAHLERYKSDAEERGNTFLARLLQKQQQRLAAYHSRQTVGFRLCQSGVIKLMKPLGRAYQIH